MLNHEKLIRRTFELARKGEGKVSPNPMVGAVIVKNNRIISEGFHRRAGAPHAEIEAIEKAKEPLSGSTLYVNLEPCCHWGKTPPCVERIIAEKFRKVVIATTDPNPLVNGRSIARMRAKKIKVVVGVLRKEGERLNEVFFKNMRTGLPFVVAKVAQSIDGKIATRTGKSRWITCVKSRRYAKSLRDKYDAVLVGINTVVMDNPRLDGIRKVPFKVVIDPFLKIAEHRYYLLTKSAERLIVFCQKKVSQKRMKLLLKKRVKVFPVRKEGKYLNLKKVLKTLYHMQITSVFVEGGAFTLGSFFDAHLVDKIYFFIAPLIIGGEKALSSIEGLGISSIQRAIKVKDINITAIGNDILFTGYPVYGG